MDKLWKWLYLEYLNALNLSKKIYITNLPLKYHHLFPKNRVDYRSVLELYPHNRLVILDLSAKKTLTPEDIKRSDIIVIGGILGSDPPSGRTYRLLTSKINNPRAYNIGDKQLSVDGSAYVALSILNGKTINELKYIDNYTITTNVGSRVILPYRYPVISGKPLIHKELIDMIIKYELPISYENNDVWGEVY